MNYNPIFIGISGGKDSTALALWARFESGWPLENIVFGFMETANEDPLTYAYLAYVSGVIAPSRIVVYNPGIGFYDLCKKKTRFPAVKTRFCTEELKIKPKHRLLARWIDDGFVPLNCTGVRTDEAHSGNNRGAAQRYEVESFRLTDMERMEILLGVHRSDPEFNEYRAILGGRNYTVDVCRPIVDWSIEDVWDIHRRYLSVDAVVSLIEEDDNLSHVDEMIEKIRADNIAYNPLYAMGAKRVGCFPCFNSRKAEVRGMARYRPGRIDDLRWLETWVGKEKDNVATFFPINTTPKRFASKRMIAKDGTVCFVPTIDDVVVWSQTGRRGATHDQLDMFLADPPTMCSIGGNCE